MNLRALYNLRFPARKPRYRNETYISMMTMRTRKFFGTIALLLLVAVWSLLGMTAAQTPWLVNSGLLQAVFYAVVGIGWVLPAMPIISWMMRPNG